MMLNSERLAIVLVHRSVSAEPVRLTDLRGTFERFVIDAGGPQLRSEPDLGCDERCEIQLGGRSVTLLVQRP